jgi:hypothetical protein
MKSRRHVLLLLLVILNLNPSAILAQSQAKRQSSVVLLPPQEKKPSRELTFGEARSMLVGKKVSIMGTILSKGYLNDWYPVVEQNGEYKTFTTGNYNKLPDSYLGKEAEVVTVQLNSLEKKRSGAGGVNALGETISADSLVNPYCDVIVRFSDGLMAIHTSYLSLIFSDFVSTRPFRLLSEKNERAKLISSQLPSIVGKTVYAVAFSKLFLPTATLESLMEQSRYNSQRTFDFPRLQPLTIVSAKYIEDKDVIVLKLKDSSGKEYLTLSKFDLKSIPSEFDLGGDKGRFFGKVVSSSPPALRISTSGLSEREIIAIRQGNIIAGMSLTALYSTIGFPEKENDWGKGGKQLIYSDGKLYIYLDANNRVRDWQSLSR